MNTLQSNLLQGIPKVWFKLIFQKISDIRILKAATTWYEFRKN